MRAWLVLAFGDERQHAGNKGYADELSQHYRYDTFVPNHTQIQPGDLLVIRDATHIVGVSRVEDVVPRETQKLMLRCPQCHRTSLKERETKLPKYRCSMCKKEFDVPETSMEDCTEFTAEFRGHFSPVHVSASASAFKEACPRYNGQLAMQEIQLGLLPAAMKAVRKVAVHLSGLPLAAAAAAPDAYVRGSEDERALIARQIRERRGQRRFRDALRSKYGSKCVISGCTLVDLLEAAHVSPYRGVKDNHASNGVLLRADLHTLFDLDLLAIDPSTLRARVHPDAAAGGYDHLGGSRLHAACADLSKAALAERWKRFIACGGLANSAA